MPVTKSAFQFKLTGFPAANRGATVALTNVLTGKRFERPVFLDGTATVRDLDPGEWEVQVDHPNLKAIGDHIFKRRVRLFPTRRPTLIPIPVPPTKFSDRPIRDIPDADLGPVQEQAAVVKEQMGALGTKVPGEVIRAEDWNVMASSVSDLADALAQLTQLVSPIGHAHPEIAEKFAEVQGNLRRFASTYGQTILEVRRQNELSGWREYLADFPVAQRGRIEPLIAELEADTQNDPVRFTRRLSTTGAKFLEAIAELDEDQLKKSGVARLRDVAISITNAGIQHDVSAELDLHSYASAVHKRPALG